MAKKLYPRSTLRRILKAHSNRSVSKNVDVLVSNTTIIGSQFNGDEDCTYAGEM